MKVKVYQFKEEIDVPDEERVIRWNAYDEQFPFPPNNNPAPLPDVKRKVLDIEKVGIFLERGYTYSHFVIEDDNHDTSLSYILHNAGRTHHALVQKAKKLDKIKGLNLFQRVFQWRKYVQ